MRRSGKGGVLWLSGEGHARSGPGQDEPTLKLNMKVRCEITICVIYYMYNNYLWVVNV